MVRVEARDNPRGEEEREGRKWKEREGRRAVKAKLWVFARFARLRP